MRIGRRDTYRDAYRVELDHGGRTLVAFVPEAMMDAARPGAPRHTPAYEWLARHRTKIEAAIISLAKGSKPKPPYDMIELMETTHAN